MRSSAAAEIEVHSNFPSLWTLEGAFVLQRARPSAHILNSSDAQDLELSGIFFKRRKEALRPDAIEVLDDSFAVVDSRRVGLMFGPRRIASGCAPELPR